MGSLTAPPCDGKFIFYYLEFVHWYIASVPNNMAWSKLKLL